MFGYLKLITSTMLRLGVFTPYTQFALYPIKSFCQLIRAYKKTGSKTVTVNIFIAHYFHSSTCNILATVNNIFNIYNY